MNVEDMKPSATTSGSTDGDAIEARFSDLCKNGLSLDEKACSNAMKLFKETKHLLSSNVSAIGSGTLEEAERFWFSVVLYSLKRLSEKIGENRQHESDESGFSLCKILRATKLNIVDFLKELPQFVVKAGSVLSNMYGEDWESRLEAKEMQANFVHLSLISKSYKHAFWELFLTSDANIEKQQNATSLPDYLSECHRFGWLLFLALRVHAFSRFKDLVTCTNGFVSILVILIIHVPIRFRNFNISGSPHFVKKGDKGVNLLASLCNMYDASEDDLRKTMEMANKLIVDVLKKKPCPAAECKMETLENIDTDGLIYFEGLMEEQSLSSCLNILEKDYGDAICNKSDLDERVFVNEKDTLLGLGSLSGGAMTVAGIKRNLDSMASPSKSISSPLSPQRPLASHANGVLGPPSVKMAVTPSALQ